MTYVSTLTGNIQLCTNYVNYAAILRPTNDQK